MSGPAVNSASRAVIFGKLPSHGDFVHRGLDDAANAAWDTWASEGLAAAQTAFGERFEHAHDNAPPWCFISGPGSLGKGWRVGAFAPSADSAGRRFVIVVAIDDLSLTEAILLGPRTAAALIDGIYRIFSERLDADSALALISTTAKNMGDLPSAVLHHLVDARADGVWWPHIGGADAEQIFVGAAPTPDLIMRSLGLVMGDPPL